MAYADIDAGKVLNKEGLLELSNQIKSYVDANAGGGSSYTAGDGIDIDSNGVIKTSSHLGLGPLFFTLIRQGTAITNAMRLKNKIYTQPSTKADIINGLKQGLIVQPQASLSITQSDLEKSENIVCINFRDTRISKTFELTYLDGFASKTLTAGRYYYYDNIGLLIEFGNPVDIWSHLPIYSPEDTYTTLGAYLNTLNTRIPSAPTTDGTYMLKCVVSSGTPTYSWEEVTVGGSY